MGNTTELGEVVEQGIKMVISVMAFLIAIVAGTALVIGALVGWLIAR